MKHRTPPALASALLRRFGPHNDALVGDLAEACAAGKSAWWYWSQVLAVIGIDAYRVVHPSLRSSGIAIAATMVLMELPMLLHLPAGVSAGRWLLLALYLMPAAATVAVPVGLTVGIAGAGPARFSPRAVPITLLAALMAALATFVMMGWVIPHLNQEFRLTLAGRLVARGAPELTITELRSLIGAGERGRLALAPLSDAWEIALNYYGRWAVTVTPLAFAVFGLWAATLERTRRRIVVVATACVYMAYIWSFPDLYRSFPPVLVAWMPPAIIAALPLLHRWTRRRRLTGDAVQEPGAAP
jgi:hypothetical protein